MLELMIDSHIHFDQYEEGDRKRIIRDLRENGIKALISVSWDLNSARTNLSLAKEFPAVYPAIGFHPEQELPSDDEVTQLQNMIENYQNKIVAIGEVGLPYYLRQKNPDLQLGPYIEMLELFIQDAGRLNKPVALHAVYEDAPIACELLEKYSIKKAHFHWFKGNQETIERMIGNGYFISLTPDILYEEEIQQLARMYPLSHIMVETDGPWQFKGPFQGQMTHPKMIHDVVRKLAEIKRENLYTVYERLYKNTKEFYLLNS